MSTEYLDKTGLTYLWGKIKSKFQEKLVSGTNIKTINNQSILGSGNLNISGGGGTSDYDQLSNRPQVNSVTLTGNKSSADLGVASASHTHTTDDISDVSGVSGHVQIGDVHICYGAVTISASANAYQETQVTLPYTYSSNPVCVASLGNRAAAARTAYATQGSLAGNKIYVGCYSTSARDIYISWMTIGA